MILEHGAPLFGVVTLLKCLCLISAFLPRLERGELGYSNLPIHAIFFWPNSLNHHYFHSNSNQHYLKTLCGIVSLQQTVNVFIPFFRIPRAPPSPSPRPPRGRERQTLVTGLQRRWYKLKIRECDLLVSGLQYV